jgi:hypothetical protein
VTEPARETFLGGIDPGLAPVVVAIDRAVMAAGPDLDVRIYYRMLTYAVAGDFHRWICAIDASGKVVRLRFLFGTRLHDPRGVLRAGTSHLATIDIASVDAVDTAFIADLVTEAVARLPEFKAEDRAQREAKRG